MTVEIAHEHPARGRTTVDPRGHRVGTIAEVVVNGVDGSARYLLLDRGLLNGELFIVPLERPEHTVEDPVPVGFGWPDVGQAPQVVFNEDDSLPPAIEEQVQEFYRVQAAVSQDPDAPGYWEQQYDAPNVLERQRWSGERPGVAPR